MSSAKWRPFCLGFNELKGTPLFAWKQHSSLHGKVCVRNEVTPLHHWYEPIHFSHKSHQRSWKHYQWYCNLMKNHFRSSHHSNTGHQTAWSAQWTWEMKLKIIHHIHDFPQDNGNSSAKQMELLQFCAKPSLFYKRERFIYWNTRYLLFFNTFLDADGLILLC